MLIMILSSFPHMFHLQYISEMTSLQVFRVDE